MSFFRRWFAYFPGSKSLILCSMLFLIRLCSSGEIFSFLGEVSWSGRISSG